jgi:helicase associated domain
MSKKLFWKSYLKIVIDYMNKNNTDIIDNDLIVDDVNIGQWVKEQKEAFFSNNLDENKMDLLIRSGVLKGSIDAWISMYEKGKADVKKLRLFSDSNFDYFDIGFVKAKEYYDFFNHLLVPDDYSCEDGFLLGKWIERQITDIKKGKLSKDKIDKLISIGFTGDSEEKNKIYHDKYVELTNQLEIFAPEACCSPDIKKLCLYPKDRLVVLFLHMKSRKIPIRVYGNKLSPILFEKDDTKLLKRYGIDIDSLYKKYWFIKK